MTTFLKTLTVCVLAAGMPFGLTAAPLFYAVISDTQKPDNDPLTDFAAAVEKVNQVEPDIVLVPGDLTNTGSENQYRGFMAIARKLSAPVVYAIGNHEGPAGEAVYRERFSAFTGQAPYVHRVFQGWHFFVLDSVSFTNGKLDHEGAVDAEQLNWLRTELASVPQKAPIVLSQHHPYHFPSSQTANEDDVLDLFAGHNLLYTLTGHKHYNHTSRDNEGILHLVTGALSFSCKPKEVGIGYRFVSTVAQDLWTAWVPTEEQEPLTKIAPVTIGWVTVTAMSDGDGIFCLRVPCSAKGGLITLAGEGRQATAELPGKGGTVIAGSDPGVLRIRVPPDSDVGTLFVPLPETFTEAIEGIFQFTCSEGLLAGPAALYRSSVPWTHHRLGRDTAPEPVISLRTPSAEAQFSRGAQIPIVAVVEKVTRRTPIALEINGQEIIPDGSGLAVICFSANGLQSKSYHFKNHLYVNGQFLTAIAPDRDVTEWERFAYVVPPELWDRANPLQFRLTAGTATDGTGANPKENNEDYLAKDVVACVDGNVLVDPAMPIGKARTIGDNSPKISTFLDCTPSQSIDLSRWVLLVHNLDTAELPAGPLNIVIRVGNAECRTRIILK